MPREGGASSIPESCADRIEKLAAYWIVRLRGRCACIVMRRERLHRHSAKCRFISGRAFSAAPCFATILAMRSGANLMSTKAGAVLATS